MVGEYGRKKKPLYVVAESVDQVHEMTSGSLKRGVKITKISRLAEQISFGAVYFSAESMK